MQIPCLNPITITHPHLFDYLTKAVFVVVEKQGNPCTITIRNTDRNEIYNNPQLWIKRNLPYAKDVTNVDNYYIVDQHGEVYPIYMQVPCNSCECCTARKMNSLTQQIEFELLDSQYEDTLNFFVTLTYRDEFLPKNNELSPREVQLFMKRLRKLVGTEIGYKYVRPIKVVYSGEYGKRNTKRPHFHLAILNFPMHLLSLKYGEFHARGIFTYCWSEKDNYQGEDNMPFRDYKFCSKGYRTKAAQKYYNKYVKGSVVVEDIYSSNLGKYIAKYIAKSNEKNNYKKVKRTVRTSSRNSFTGRKILNTIIKKAYYRRPPFVKKSIKLGYNYFIKNIQPQIAHTLKNSFTYLNLSNKVVEDAQICSYYIAKMFPTTSRIVPPEIRQSEYQLKTSVFELSKRNIRVTFEDPLFTPYYYEEYEKKCYPEHQKKRLQTLKDISIMDNETLIQQCKDLFYKIYGFFDYHIVEIIQESKKMRDTFLRYCIDNAKDTATQIIQLKAQYNKTHLLTKL